MKRIVIAAALAVIASGAIAQQGGAGGPAPGTGPSAEFQRGWCSGWLTAVNVGNQNYNSWSTFSAAVNPKLKLDPPADPNSKKPRVVTKDGEAARIIISSIPLYILPPRQDGKVTLGDGTVIDCAANKPGGTVAPEAPAKQ